MDREVSPLADTTFWMIKSTTETDQSLPWACRIKVGLWTRDKPKPPVERDIERHLRPPLFADTASLTSAGSSALWRDEDGHVFQLWCHACGHSNFEDAQEFRDHHSHIHETEFNGWKEMIEECGIYIRTEDPTPMKTHAPQKTPSPKNTESPSLRKMKSVQVFPGEAWNEDREKFTGWAFGHLIKRVKIKRRFQEQMGELNSSAQFLAEDLFLKHGTFKPQYTNILVGSGLSWKEAHNCDIAIIERIEVAGTRRREGFGTGMVVKFCDLVSSHTRKGQRTLIFWDSSPLSNPHFEKLDGDEHAAAVKGFIKLFDGLEIETTPEFYPWHCIVVTGSGEALR